jgi:hypothetical protein
MVCFGLRGKRRLRNNLKAANVEKPLKRLKHGETRSIRLKLGVSETDSFVNLCIGTDYPGVTPL